MKEIKAYTRRSRVNGGLNALNKADAPGITVVEVHPVGYSYEPNYFEPRFEKTVLKRYGYLEIVNLEVVCWDKDLEKSKDHSARVPHWR
jgi:nitrogen regulatory protein PII